MPEARWLLLLHQIPPKPAYFRARVLRRLAQVGALAIKNSAYLLPDREAALEDFEWIWQEITEAGGAAWLFRAETLAGTSAAQIEASFSELRKADYEELIQLARSVLLTKSTDDQVFPAYGRLSRRRQEVGRIDFFDSPGRRELEELMSEIEKEVRASGSHETSLALSPGGKAWVTRKGVRIDRIGSAWLIRRFIDAEASFRFVEADRYVRSEGDVRFDMLDGEFTHRGNLCTFEVLLAGGDLASDPALAAIAEVIHDIDLKEDRFARPETIGIARTIDGICLQTTVDQVRLERGAMIFDSLYESFGSLA